MEDEEYIRIYGKTRNDMLAETNREIHKAFKAGNKEQVKKLIALFKEVFVGDDVFWANEVASNLMISVIMIALALIFAVVVGFANLGVFEYEGGSLAAHVSVCLIQLLIGILLNAVFKGEKKWLKYVLMLIICMTIASAHTIFGYSAEMSLVLPVVLSVKYLSEKFTAIVAVFSGVLMLLSSILTVFWSVSPDLNTVALSSGTVLNIETTLNAAVSSQTYVMSEYLRNQLAMSFFPNLMQFLLITAVCISVAKWGHRTVLEQAQVTKEFSRVDTELNMAKDIQAKVLPNIFPVFPERPEIDIYASMTPAREVGGDFYDYFLIDDDHLGLVIADVSGKGMPAALFMMIGKTLIKNQALLGLAPAEVLSAVNRQLCESNESDLFITAWFGILELSSGKLASANAGHEYPALKRRNGAYEYIKDKHGFVLGGLEMSRYKEYEVVLEPGDRLFLYTDGVTEATDKNERLFGMNQLRDALNRSAIDDEKTELTGVKRAVDAFVGSAPQFDDITMLGVTYFGSEGK